MEVLTILGTLASIVGAIISFQQARKAASNAEIAEQAKESILDKKNTEEIAKIHSKTKDLLEEIKKIGPTARPDKIKGIDNNQLAEKILSYKSYINEHKNILNNENQNKTITLCEELSKPINILATLKSPKTILEEGKRIFFLIDNYLAVIKKELDEVKMK